LSAESEATSGAPRVALRAVAFSESTDVIL
jgi:hypothetical protein